MEKPQRISFVVTAGPTREFIDPARFISNPSTGRMGFAVAAEAARRGYDTVLVAGPCSLKTPPGVRRVDVTSALEMRDAVAKSLAEGKPVLVAAAAVADWRPARRASKKLKKSDMSGTLLLVRNPDILKEASAFMKVGFAAETGNPEKEARRKLREKNLDMIVANNIAQEGAGFGSPTNKTVFFMKDGRIEDVPMMDKRAVARRIVSRIEELAVRNA